MTTTFERLKEILVYTSGVNDELITPDATIADDLGFDSLDMVECVMAAEDEFGVMIDDEVLEKIVTVQDAVSAIDHALSNSGVPA